MTKQAFDFKAVQSIWSYLLVKQVRKPEIHELTLNQQTFKLLAPPYDTGCHDYGGRDSNWRFSGRHQCEFECLNRHLKEQLNCTDDFIEYYSIESINRKQILKKALKKESLVSCERQNRLKVIDEFAKVCASSCAPPCTDFKYSIKYFFRSLKRSSGIVQIKFVFDNNGFVVKYVSEPRMTLFDLFYEVGGFISLWFGFTLLDVLLYLIRIMSKRFFVIIA